MKPNKSNIKKPKPKYVTLKVLDDEVTRIRVMCILGCNKLEESGQFRTLHNGELHDLF
jgi:hypothetical protein